MTALQVAIRQARETDQAQIEALIAQGGCGARPDGECYVANVGDQVVGAVSLIRLDDDEWWLAGLCVHPDFRRQGIGRALHEHAILQAEAYGSGTLRFSANAKNRAVHRLALQSQFSLVGRYALYQTDVLFQRADEFSLAHNVEVARGFLDSSPFYVHAQRSMEDESVWHFLVDERLRSYAAQSRVYTWHGKRHSPNAPDGVIIFAANSAPPLLTLAYLDAAVGALADLCRAVRRLAAAHGYQRIQHRFLVRPERLVAIEQAGWRPPETGSEDRDLFSRPLGIHPDRLIDP